MEISRTKEILNKFQNKRIMVIGDFYLDEYFHCSAEKFSPEAPVPRALVQQIEHFPGCAGNVANNLRSLGAHVLCVGVIGNDEKGVILRNKLLEKGIMTSTLYPDATRKTGVFSRILLENSGDTKQHTIRFDQENKNTLDQTVFQKVYQMIEENISSVDVIFVADYDEAKNTGIITTESLQNIASISHQHGKLLVGISRLKIKEFNNFDMLVCNEKELSESSNISINSDSDLQQAARDFQNLTKAKNLIITQGKKGLTIFSNTNEPVSFPSYAKNVVDVCGAGDTLTSAFTLALVSGASDTESAFIASHAAAVAVGKEGTAPANVEEIIGSITSGNGEKNKVALNHNELNEYLTDLKKSGKKVVFTNGYFDLIHSGHINFLREARKHGDVLIVALNSDRSTRENKGDGRPILNEEERTNIMSSLDFVDLVTVFDELTPIKTISLLQPDILVKGGNFTTDEVVGKDIVEAYGGRVEIIKAKSPNSVDNIINKITKTR